jgi:mediator of RNA polymerase II transcription subunit 21
VQLANQFVASLYYINKHHDLQTLSATDVVRQEKKTEDGQDPREKEGVYEYRIPYSTIN